MANRLILLICIVAIGTVFSCKKASEKTAQSASAAPNGGPVMEGHFDGFRSHLGSTIVCPSDWTSTDKGDTWTLKSPDHHAIITVWTFTVQGSGTMQEFQNTMASSITKEGTWKDSEWTAINIGGTAAVKRVFEPQDAESQLPCRAYLLQTGDFYSAILLRASDEAMTLNGDFYESIVKSFHGPGQAEAATRPSSSGSQ
jgi:hypothetical protein